MNFAIPIRDFLRLNCSQRPTTWAQMAATDRSASTTRFIRAHGSTNEAPEAGAATGGFAAFQSRLKESVGESVTVVLQEAGRTNVFEFTVE